MQKDKNVSKKRYVFCGILMLLPKPESMVLLNPVLVSLLFVAHPIHVSVTSLEINTEKKELFISHKMFTDDFSLLFYHLYEKNLQPQPGKDFTPVELEVINGYMSEAFILDLGRNRLPLRFVRKDQDDLSTWLYYSGELPTHHFKNLVLTNVLMLDLYEDQTNLVIVSDGRNEKGYTFNYMERRMEIEIFRDSESESE